MKSRHWLALVPVASALACSAPNASTLTHPPRRASFPLFVTIPGSTLGGGAIYQIDAPTELDAPSEAVLLQSGIDFPAAIAVARDGTIFYTDRATSTTGRIMRYAGEGVAPEVVAEGLLDPQGLALDRSGKMYVAETGAGQISLVNQGDGTREAIVSDLAGPRAIATDENDNLFVAEATGGDVIKIIPDGTRVTIASGLVNPIAAGPGLVGNTFYLTANTGMADGVTYKVSESGATETYLSRLVNPKALAWGDETILYVAEGSPALRVISYSIVTTQRTEVSALPDEPHSIAFRPLN